MPENKWDKYIESEEPSANKWDKYAVEPDNVKKKAFGVLAPPSTGALPSSATLSPLEIPRPQGRSEKVIKSKPQSIEEAAKADKLNNESRLAGVYNTIVGALPNLVGATAKFIDFTASLPTGRYGMERAVQAAGGGNLAKDRRKAIDDAVMKAEDFLRSKASSREGERIRQSKLDVTNGLGMDDLQALPEVAAKFVADMGLAYATGGASFALQGYDSGLKEIDNLPDSDKISENTKQFVGLSQGVIDGVLEKIGLDKVLKNTGASKIIRNKVIKEVADELSKKGARVTEETVANMIASKTKTFANKIKNVGISGLKSGGIEGVTEAAQEGLGDVVKYVANKIEGKEIFDEQELKNSLSKRVINSFAIGGAFGGLAGGGIASLQNVDTYVRDQIGKAKSEEDVKNIVNEINSKVQDGSMTESEAAVIMPKVQEYVEISAKIPNEVSDEVRGDLIKAISERKELEEELSKKQSELESVDDAFKNDKQKEINLIKESIDEYNKYIQDKSQQEFSSEEDLIENQVPQEEIITEEQFKAPIVETVEEESQVIPLQEQQKSQDITLQKEDWSSQQQKIENDPTLSIKQKEEAKKASTAKVLGNLPFSSFKYTGKLGKTKASQRGVTYLTSDRGYASFYESGVEKPNNKALEELSNLKPPIKPEKVELSSKEEIDYQKSIGEPLTPFAGIYQTKAEVDAQNKLLEERYQKSLKEYENRKKQLEKEAADYLSPTFLYGKSMNLDIDFSKDSPQAIFNKLKSKGISKEFKGGDFLDNYESDLKEYAAKNGIDYYDGIKGGVKGSMNISPDEIILINKDKAILRSELAEAYQKAKADGSNPELVKAVEDLLGKPQEKVEPPVQVKKETVAGEVLTEKEPVSEVEGDVIVTPSGMTEKERTAAIEERKKKTSVTSQTSQRNELVMRALSLFGDGGENKGRGKNYLNSSQGLQEVNKLRADARALGLELDASRGAIVRRTDTGRTVKVKYDNKADSDAVVEDSGVVLRDRNRNVQEVFQELTDNNIFLDVPTGGGKRMSAEQVNAAIEDINNGIPSKRANRYLDMLEKAIEEDAFPLYDKGLGEFTPPLSEIRSTVFGEQRETVGEPMDENFINDWLNDEVDITPEEEQRLLDNFENILEEYETTTGLEEGTEAKVPETKQPAEKRVSEKAEQAKPSEKEAVKEDTIKDLIDKLPKAQKLRERELSKIIDANFDKIVNKLINENKADKKCS